MPVTRKGGDREGRRKGSAPRQIATIVVAVAVALAARSSLADHYVVPSGSMLPTVHEGDRIVVNKLAYGFRLPFTRLFLIEGHGPNRGDVVVLLSPESGIVLLKRVVACPGDTIEVVGGHLVINGRRLPVTDHDGQLMEELGGSLHPVRLTRGGGPDFGPEVIPAGRYLVLGDNRGDSRDGRIFGLVERNAILGQAIASYYRSGELGWFPL